MRKLSKVLKVVGLGIITFNVMASDYVNIHTHDNVFFNAALPNIANLTSFELVPIGIILMLVGEIVGLINNK